MLFLRLRFLVIRIRIVDIVLRDINLASIVIYYQNYALFRNTSGPGAHNGLVLKDILCFMPDFQSLAPGNLDHPVVTFCRHSELHHFKVLNPGFSLDFPSLETATHSKIIYLDLRYIVGDILTRPVILERRLISDCFKADQ